jgi:hypothetical protein
MCVFVENMVTMISKTVVNTLRTGDANLRLLRFCITTVKDR